MDASAFTEILASLGVGGTLAALVLLWKRSDDQRYSSTLASLFDELRKLTELVIDGLSKNTEAFISMQRKLEEQTRTDDTLARLEGQLREIVQESRKRNGETKEEK